MFSVGLTRSTPNGSADLFVIVINIYIYMNVAENPLNNKKEGKSNNYLVDSVRRHFCIISFIFVVVFFPQRRKLTEV